MLEVLLAAIFGCRCACDSSASDRLRQRDPSFVGEMSAGKAANARCVVREGFRCGLPTLRRTRQPPKGCNEPVDVVFVVVDMRADAHASDAGRDVDVLRRKPMDQLFWHAEWKLQAQDMRGAH